MHAYIMNKQTRIISLEKYMIANFNLFDYRFDSKGYRQQICKCSPREKCSEKCADFQTDLHSNLCGFYPTEIEMRDQRNEIQNDAKLTSFAYDPDCMFQYCLKSIWLRSGSWNLQNIEIQ